jgi:hypothetical protein
MTRRLLAILAGALCALVAVPAASAEARLRPAPTVTRVLCVEKCTRDGRQVQRWGVVRVRGRGFPRGMVARFLRRGWPTPVMRVHYRNSTWVWVRVPRQARTSSLVLYARGRRPTRPVLVRVYIPPRRAAPRPRPVGAATPPPSASPFAGPGMWIWNVPRTADGTAAGIAAAARQAGYRTLFIKSSDGARPWRQFTPELVAALHAAGLKVCGWGYVYGTDPIGEADAALPSIRAGADCWVIDAEVEYEGRYAQAQQFVTRLRSQVGASFPVALAPFPYVNYHPAFPYSVFLGPGAAQVNQPQMYWKFIGHSVDTTYAKTYSWSLIYKRPIAPLGQTSEDPPAGDIARFTQLAAAVGAPGLSWWVWETSNLADFLQGAQPPTPMTAPPPSMNIVTLRAGTRGDAVVWLQQLLVAWGQPVTVDGGFGPQTQGAVAAVQTGFGLPATGAVDPATWARLLQRDPAPVNWSAPATAARAARAARVGASGGRRVTGPAASAGLRGRDELHGHSLGRTGGR